MLQFGQACLATAAWKSQVPDLYAKAIWDSASEIEREGGLRRLFRIKQVYEGFERYVAGMDKAAWRKRRLTTWRSQLVLAAFLAGKRKRAVEVYAALGRSFDTSAFRNFKQLDREKTLAYLNEKVQAK